MAIWEFLVIAAWNWWRQQFAGPGPPLQQEITWNRDLLNFGANGDTSLPEVAEQTSNSCTAICVCHFMLQELTSHDSIWTLPSRLQGPYGLQRRGYVLGVAVMVARMKWRMVEVYPPPMVRPENVYESNQEMSHSIFVYTFHATLAYVSVTVTCIGFDKQLSKPNSHSSLWQCNMHPRGYHETWGCHTLIGNINKLWRLLQIIRCMLLGCPQEPFANYPINHQKQ